MLVVVASYRRNVYAYPSGGGDYEVASKNLGPAVGVTVASALLVDYTLTVAVSVSSGVANLASAFPSLSRHVVLLAVLIVAVITLLNLRGLRESGTAFAIPTYFFVAVIGLMIVSGLVQWALGHNLTAESAQLRHQAPAELRRTRGSVPGAARLRVRLYGADRCRGDQQRRAGLQTAEEQERRDDPGVARRIAVAMFAGVTALALITHVHVARSG